MSSSCLIPKVNEFKVQCLHEKKILTTNSWKQTNLLNDLTLSWDDKKTKTLFQNRIMISLSFAIWYLYLNWYPMLVAILDFIVKILYNIIIGICIGFLEHYFVVMCMHKLVSNHTCQGKYTFVETMQ